jgi:hypothetical protein
MRPYPSPLEELAAFSIAFLSGVAFGVSMISYAKRLRRSPPHAN